MAEYSRIEWTDHTWNPWLGCQKVGPGCDNCYAEAYNARFAGGIAINWGPGAPRRRTSAANWRKPITWNSVHAAFQAEHGRRQRVFCASLADVFDNAVDPAWREDLFQLIEATPSLDWLLLTKRIGNVRNMLPVPFDFDRLYPNVWIGATIVNQAEADRDIPKLLELPARVRFLSMEPLLGPVDLTAVRHTARPGYFGDCLEWHHRPHGEAEPWPGVNWVIVGGESGPDARPMNPLWVGNLRDQCRTAGVPFLFKQWGEWSPGPGDFGAGRRETAAIAMDGYVARDGIRQREHPTGADGWSLVHRVGKKAAGRQLDGLQWDEFPDHPA
jgi:protein gp37